MRTHSENPDLARLVESIDAWHARVPETIGQIANVAIDAISQDLRTLERQVEEVAATVLASTSRFAGAGIVSVHPMVTANSRSLLWWVTQRNSRQIEPLPLDPDLTELGNYRSALDDLEWYRVPASTRRSHMTGPFVDYMCTDEFAFTFTAPLEIAGDFYGVAGIDMTVHSLEVEVESILEDLSEDAILLANNDLVAISLNPRFVTGSRLKSAQLAEHTITPVGGTSLFVALPK